MAEASETLRFFRPLMNNFSTKLFVPAPLAEHISNIESRDGVTLVNHKCKMWHVQLHIENKDLYFGGEAWQNFVQDNDLEVGHLLFFKYKGNMVFTFRIYDLTSCERTSRQKKITKDQLIQVEKSSQSTAEDAVGCSRKRRGQEAQNTSNTKNAAHSNKRKRGKEALNTSMDNAYFDVTITDKCLKRSELHVPAAFRDCSGLSTRHTGFSIRDPEGRTWLSSVVRWGNRFRACKGWLKFCREHQLKAGDKLRFELVSAKEKDNMMHLNMFKL